MGLIEKVPKVSIIVPVYNVEPYLKKCLESLVNQTLRDLEIIVVNDSSLDESQLIITDFQQRYPDKIKSFIKPNKGIAHTRNYAITKSTGEYIGFVDGDDWVELSMFDEMYKLAIEEDADLVVCDFLMDWESDGVSRYIKGVRPMTNDIIRNLILSPCSAWNKLYRRELLLNYNITYPDGLWYEDLATTSKYFLHCDKVSYINKAYVHYVQRPGSIMSMVDEKSLDIYKAIESIESYYNQNHVDVTYYFELMYLSIENLALYSCLRFLKLEDGETYIKEVIDYMNEKYPGWMNNKYLNCLSIKNRFILKLLATKQIKLLKGFIFMKQILWK